MSINNLGSIVLQLLIFLTTLVNMTFAVANLEPLLLILMYGLSKFFAIPPESGIVANCQHKSLYYGET